MTVYAMSKRSFLEEAIYLAERRTEERIIKLLEELKAKMDALSMPGYKTGSEIMPIRASGVEIAIRTIRESSNGD